MSTEAKKSAKSSEPDKIITVRFKPDELAALDQIAKAAGVDRSKWLRQAAVQSREWWTAAGGSTALNAASSLDYSLSALQKTQAELAGLRRDVNSGFANNVNALARRQHQGESVSINVENLRNAVDAEAVKIASELSRIYSELHKALHPLDIQ